MNLFPETLHISFLCSTIFTFSIFFWFFSFIHLIIFRMNGICGMSLVLFEDATTVLLYSNNSEYSVITVRFLTRIFESLWIWSLILIRKFTWNDNYFMRKAGFRLGWVFLWTSVTEFLIYLRNILSWCDDYRMYWQYHFLNKIRNKYI